MNYATSQYPSKHSYHNQDNRESSQRIHHQQKAVTNSSYYHQPGHHQPALEKYQNSKETAPRSTSKAVVPCDGYKNDSFIGNSYESKSENPDLNYCVGQAYTSEKYCDPQYVYKKTNSNNVYNYKTNELLNTQTSNENVVKSNSDKPKVVSENYPNVTKPKVPNRTTYYQTIVNKTHSRHKSSRRVLPTNAYEQSKQVISNYPATKPDLQNTQGPKPVQYSSQHYPSEAKRPDYYQVPTTTASHTAGSYQYTNHKSDSQQPHVSNNTSHSGWNDPAYANSRSYNKVNPEHGATGYREKQHTNAAYPTNTKPYGYYPSGKTYTDARSKTSDPNYSYATNSDYYQKGNVTYSRSGSSHGAASDVYKNSNHATENVNYPSKSSSYHQHSRTLSDKNRSYYPNQESNYKSYHPENVPKQRTEDPHGYKTHSDINSYSNYGNLNSVKSKEPVTRPAEVQKPVPPEQITQNPVEPSPVVHPAVCEANSYYPSPSKDKNRYYSNSDSTHFVHRRTPPPVSKPQTSFEPSKLATKDSESFKISTTTAISSYSHRPPVSSTPPSYDNSRSVVKTLWSPTATTPTVTSAPSREIITASSRDSHSSHSNSSISSLSQLSQSLGPGAASCKLLSFY